MISPEIAVALVRISPRQIERRLAGARKKGELKGKSTAKRGELLKNQVPVRAYFTRDERKPGFFELDTAAHCGTGAHGHFCRTPAVTGVSSCWTELRALLAD
jgi:hypothetical protein